MSIEDPVPGELFRDTRYGTVKYIGRTSSGEMAVEDSKSMLRRTSPDHLIQGFKVGQVWKTRSGNRATILALFSLAQQDWVSYGLRNSDTPRTASVSDFQTHVMEH